MVERNRTMKIAVFKYKASVAKWTDNGGGECLDTELIENEINEFCEDKEVIDIKVNTIDYDYHNNGGCNGVTIVYTIMYK
jgi:hypothetical protein